MSRLSEIRQRWQMTEQTVGRLPWKHETSAPDTGEPDVIFDGYGEEVATVGTGSFTDWWVAEFITHSFTDVRALGEMTEVAEGIVDWCMEHGIKSAPESLQPYLQVLCETSQAFEAGQPVQPAQAQQGGEGGERGGE